MAGAAQAQNLNATFDNYDPKTTDPDLLRNNSEIKSFTTSRFTYPAVRIFYKPHPRLDELPNDPAPLPLLVFVHGLGGSVVQFQPLLSSLTHNSSCLAIDLPGCGLSELSPTAWDAYTNEALTELLDVVIATYRNKQAGQGVVLIGHSMGCSLSARLASPDASKIADHVMALIAICPPAGPPTAEQVNTFRKLLWIPTPVFDLWRSWDARGGVDSASIKRFVGADADLESRRLQKRFNRQSRTPTWRRMAWGSLPTYEDGVAKGGIAGQDIWATLDIPVFLISGGKDHITPAKEIERIAAFLKADVSIPQELTLGYHQPIVDVAAPIDTSVNMGKPAGSITEITEQDFQREKNQLADSSEDDALEDPTTPHEVSAVGVPPQPQRPAKVVKTIVIPHGTHALIYTQDCSHVLASIIADFLSQHITGRLSRSWQLQYLNKEGKWELKNLTKWQGVVPVSKSVAGVFRAMKTMREVDEEHSPVRFVEKWGNIVKDVVDISKDIPIYDPAGLQRAGVRYHKFPTVSKIPPTDAEVDKFIALVDRLRKEQATRAEQEHWDPDSEHAVGVHCHYGYNRTGYFIVCYLIERCGHGVQQAIDAFASARPKGIRHSHFKDQLFVRYSGLGRRTAAVSSSSAS
ncbi:dual specificity phosphatase catalytic domain-containing protein [Coniella lustricola]|uniref:Dual specificity phosphatase catalytic domain-containing protein n=1 Tax=Coniella lustricola TaxID=2025994 RepID=A0A2T2ZZ25_9PEZI|nr:dual specificity phosphatase catalytic domain-containing protein [Coniella lustricola]